MYSSESIDFHISLKIVSVGFEPSRCMTYKRLLYTLAGPPIHTSHQVGQSVEFDFDKQFIDNDYTQVRKWKKAQKQE